MHEELEFVIEESKDSMEKTIRHFTDGLSKIHAGKASPQMLSDISIEYYGTRTPLNQAASVNTPDPKTIVIQPWDRSILEAIEKAIYGANLGFNPQNNGEIIRINVPPLTEERRKQLVKFISQEGETTKVSLRNTRKKANDEIKKIQKDGAPEDDAKKAEDTIQEITNEFTKKVDEILKKKEIEIMTV